VASAHTALLWASVFLLVYLRVSPPSFPQSLSYQPIIKCGLETEHKPCFDHWGFEWNCSLAVFQFALPLVLMLGLISWMEATPAFPVKGFHYNRPPPRS
jgi:hypothetical protein